LCFLGSQLLKLTKQLWDGRSGRITAEKRYLFPGVITSGLLPGGLPEPCFRLAKAQLLAVAGFGFPAPLRRPRFYHASGFAGGI
jgi:hypothetical protein